MPDRASSPRAARPSAAGSCSVLVDASYERERERSYSFMSAGQFLVNERFSRSSDRDSAVSGTRAFFLFPRPRWLKLEPQARGGVVTVRLDPVRVVEIGRSGFISRMTGAVIEEAPAITATDPGRRRLQALRGRGAGRGLGARRGGLPEVPGRGVHLHGPRRAHLQRAQPGGLQLRGPAPPGPGARERCRAGAVPDGAVRRRSSTSLRSGPGPGAPTSPCSSRRARSRLRPAGPSRRASSGARRPERAARAAPAVRWPSTSTSSPFTRTWSTPSAGCRPSA